MHPLIDPVIVRTIRETGSASRDLPDRVRMLDDYGLPHDRTAHTIVMTGCLVLSAMPGVLQALARLFEHTGLSYSFLSMEFCCGNYLYRPAIKERSDEAMAECRGLSQEFVGRNVQRAKELGGQRIAIFCSPCYSIYRHAFPQERIVFYPALLDELSGDLRWDGKIDYYAGCYKLHRRLSPVPMDLGSTDNLLARIQGLDVHRISAPKCCFTPEGVAHMIGQVETRTMLHVCTGCYGQAVSHLPKDLEIQVLMLPEFVNKVMNLP